MLSKEDLTKFRKIVRQEVETESQNLKDDLQSEMKINMIRLSKKIDKLENRQKNIEIKLGKMEKKQNTYFNFLDKEELKVEERVTRVEKYLKLAPIS